MQFIQRIKRDGGYLLNEILEDFQSDSETESEPEVVEEKPKKSSAVAEKQAVTAPTTLDVIGPPKILKFQPETQQAEIRVPSPTMSMESEPIQNLGQFMQDFNIYVEGGMPCEFCSTLTKPWPTINIQEIKNPETVCC
jgi:hypothetical protein